MNVEVAVIGLGAMGRAACAVLAERGVRVAGLEQFAFEHDQGSSTGKTRIIRKAYFEDPAYVPLLERAYAGWRTLEQRTGTQLLDLYGVLMVGRPASKTISGVERSAREFDVPVERYEARDLRRRFPDCTPRADEVGIFEPEAGVVFPERANAAHLAVARSAGATLRERAAIAAIDPQGDAVVLHFADGSTIQAQRVIVTAGTWTVQLLRDLRLPLQIDPNVQYWFRPPAGRCTPRTLPAYFVERDEFSRPFYGMPDTGDGVKFAFHGSGNTLAQVRDALEQWLPGAGDRLVSEKACKYTMTPDGNFAIGRHPHDARIVIACGFSGHGYKFAPVIGEIVADLAMDRQPPFDLDVLSLNRLL